MASASVKPTVEQSNKFAENELDLASASEIPSRKQKYEAAKMQAQIECKIQEAKARKSQWQKFIAVITPGLQATTESDKSEATAMLNIAQAQIKWLNQKVKRNLEKVAPPGSEVPYMKQRGELAENLWHTEDKFQRTFVQIIEWQKAMVALTPALPTTKKSQRTEVTAILKLAHAEIHRLHIKTQKILEEAASSSKIPVLKQGGKLAEKLWRKENKIQKTDAQIVEWQKIIAECTPRLQASAESRRSEAAAILKTARAEIFRLTRLIMRVLEEAASNYDLPIVRPIDELAGEMWKIKHEIGMTFAQIVEWQKIIVGFDPGFRATKELQSSEVTELLETAHANIRRLTKETQRVLEGAVPTSKSLSQRQRSELADVLRQIEYKIGRTNAKFSQWQKAVAENIPVLRASAESRRSKVTAMLKTARAEIDQLTQKYMQKYNSILKDEHSRESSLEFQNTKV